MPSPLGLLFLAECRGSPLAVQFVDVEGETGPLERVKRDYPASTLERSSGTRTHGLLQAYFAGRPAVWEFSAGIAGSPFELQVWRLLHAIPFGRTETYGRVAERLGHPGSARAVGRANHANPVAILIPCHRVVGGRGALEGYGGGLWRKQWLLRHEGVLLV